MVPATGFSGKTRLVTVMSGSVDSVAVVVAVIWLLFSKISVIWWLASPITDNTWLPAVVGVQLKVTVVDSPTLSPGSVIFYFWVLLSHSFTTKVPAFAVPMLVTVAVTV